MFTYFIKTGIITEDKLLELLAFNARKRFNIPMKLDFSVWDLNTLEVVNTDEFLSKGRSTPFEGYELYGKNLLTVCDGKIVYNNSENINDINGGSYGKA